MLYNINYNLIFQQGDDNIFAHKIDDEISLVLPHPEVDAEILFALLEHSRKEIEAWMPWAKNLKAMENMKSFLSNELKKFITDHALTVIIEYKNNYCGVISFNGFNMMNNSTQLVYWLDNNFVGNNIMHRAVIGMCDLGFTEYKLNKIEILVAVDNDKSNSVAQRAGFKLDGVERAGVELNDGYHNCNVWSLLNDEWK